MPGTATGLSRLVKAPKRYLVDPSLLASALNVDAPAVLRDGSLLGRLIETFVLAQIRPELAYRTTPVPSLRAHLRAADRSIVGVSGNCTTQG